ncbi:MAG: hypothetical protein IJY88_01195 [Clostridia bacterium]|nr:hypothetical protein [Clostridia bacterium]
MLFNMLVKVLSENEFGGEMLERLEAPAFLTDNSLCVTAVNTEAALTLCDIREGIDISRFLSESTAETVASMISQELCSADISVKGAKRSATVLCGRECRLFIVGAELGVEKDVFKALGELSGYDMELIRAKQAKNNIMDIALQLRAEQFVPRRLPFFSAYSALYALQEELLADHPDVCAHVNFNYIDAKGYAKGSERDFALIAVALVSSLIPQTENGILDISMVCDRESVVLHFLGSVNKEIGVAELKEEHLRLLAEGNAWELVKDGNGGYSLIMPFVKGGEEFMVRDISAEFLRKIVAVVFGARNG